MPKMGLTKKVLSKKFESFVKKQIEEEKDIWFLNAEVNRFNAREFHITLPRDGQLARIFRVKISEIK